MKLATWNVNSIRARMDLLLDWLQRREPDVLCLQETKVVDELFPEQPIADLGYHCAFAGQKTYNGVALLSREPLDDVRVEYPLATNQEQRLISGVYHGVRVYSAYFPNGRDPLHENYEMKLQWIANLGELIMGGLSPDTPGLVPVALLGDYNVAPDPRDVYSVEAMDGRIHFTDRERAAIQALLDRGLVDAFRAVRPESGIYSWWDYRLNAFRRDLGLRIDHVFVSPALVARATDAYVDKEERGKEKASDHAPVVVELDA